MASPPKPASTTDRNGRKSRGEHNLVELDVMFGRMMGLADGQKVGRKQILAANILSVSIGQRSRSSGPSCSAHSQRRAADPG